MNPAEVHVWLAFDRELRDATLLRSAESQLSDEEHLRRARLRTAQLRHQFLIARALLRGTLSHYASNVAPRDWRFVTGPHGRPSLAPAFAATGLHFNLAHTHGLVALAVAREPVVGVDVENVIVRAPQLAIANRYFTSDESRALSALPGTERARRFYALWTLKESWLKATGEGLTAGLGNVSFDLDEEHRVKSVTLARDDAGRWRFWQMTPSSEHALALALRATPGSLVVDPVIHDFPRDLPP